MIVTDSDIKLLLRRIRELESFVEEITETLTEARKYFIEDESWYWEEEVNKYGEIIEKSKLLLEHRLKKKEGER